MTRQAHTALWHTVTVCSPCRPAAAGTARTWCCCVDQAAGAQPVEIRGPPQRLERTVRQVGLGLWAGAMGWGRGLGPWAGAGSRVMRGRVRARLTLVVVCRRRRARHPSFPWFAQCRALHPRFSYRFLPFLGTKAPTHPPTHPPACRLPRWGCFPTVITEPSPSGKVGQVFHPLQDRIMTVREYARAQVRAGGREIGCVAVLAIGLLRKLRRICA